jgi:hypothetical protein
MHYLATLRVLWLNGLGLWEPLQGPSFQIKRGEFVQIKRMVKTQSELLVQVIFHIRSKGILLNVPPDVFNCTRPYESAPPLALSFTGNSRYLESQGNQAVIVDCIYGQSYSSAVFNNEFHGITVTQVLKEYQPPLYVGNKYVKMSVKQTSQNYQLPR